MLAILEASPRHTHRFLPRPWDAWTPFGLAARGLVALFRSVIGVVIVRSQKAL
jgi:hypothetical protein